MFCSWVPDNLKKSTIWGLVKKFSVNPTMYSEMLRAVPTNKASPIEPPMGKPSERDKT